MEISLSFSSEPKNKSYRILFYSGTLASLIGGNKQIFPEETPRQYHNLTGGWIINEVVRRATPDNVTLGAYIR